MDGWVHGGNIQSSSGNRPWPIDSSGHWFRLGRSRDDGICRMNFRTKHPKSHHALIGMLARPHLQHTWCPRASSTRRMRQVSTKSAAATRSMARSALSAGGRASIWADGRCQGNIEPLHLRQDGAVRASRSSNISSTCRDADLGCHDRSVRRAHHRDLPRSGIVAREIARLRYAAGRYRGHSHRHRILHGDCAEAHGAAFGRIEIGRFKAC